MREIKFRAWHREKNIMLLANSLQELMMGSEVFKNVPEFVYFLDFMQYTGVKDKNGKEIYEGDIIKYLEDEYKECIGTVVYDFARFSVKWHSEQTEYLRNDLYFWATKRKIEVIGNIYENPELLGGKECI